MLIIRADNVHKAYRRFIALNGVSLEFGPGITCLLGRNGAGKSTLVRQLVGIEQPTSGSVRWELDDTLVSGRAGFAVIGWLPQAFGFPPGLSVREFVAYAAWLKEFPREQTGERVAEVVAQVGLAGASDKRLGDLSGGMLRRAGLAAAIVHRPAGLILDEPTAGLDPVQRADFHERIRVLGESTTVLLATHLLEDVHAVASRVSVLDGGSAVWHGDTAALSALGGNDTVSVDSLRSGLIELIGRELS
ncbi:ATP-binding cassette domain-containing protein [Nocardioides sp.]|uniref:ATP-binding cassette domain-containing protein n=1 Tax=Nocardioides sp. TaxID=35761 RepID=UPI003D0CDCD1